MKLDKLYLFSSLFLTVMAGCNRHDSIKSGELHFSLLTKDQTHIDFNNQVTETDSVNFLTDQYMYIGSGVAVGDFNNDGLQDLFFAGSQVSSKLYINKGNLEFEDITEKAGVQTNTWCTGVSVVDINNDGWPDIYVCVSHSPYASKRKNLLFINQHNLTFKEEAADYGLQDSGYSTQAAFFDYDKDGLLDMYLMNHSLIKGQPNNLLSQTIGGDQSAADKLYKNMGTPAGMDHPVFKDVSQEAGIRENGYGLGLIVSDFNNDGWPDIYVANDFVSNDLLWLNNKNGTFTNGIDHSLRHQSFNSMGVDVADINNDLLPDIGVLDMLPETNERKKMMFAGSNAERYDLDQRLGGYQPEFTRNMLQLNNGLRKKDSVWEPFYSEIGRLAGISETDWSWSILMADFDNDGWKDIHITNGLAKDLTNNDFLLFRDKPGAEDISFGGGHSRSVDNFNAAEIRKELDKHGSVKVDNYFFHNNGNLTFSNTTAETGIAIPSISQGAVYADLDNDGDLDLVVNNMNQEAFIWKNELRKSAGDSTHNYLTIKLKGDKGNIDGFGSKLTLFSKGMTQFLEQNPVRGYTSSVDNRLHFGVGDAVMIDSLKIIWPDNRTQKIENVKSNQLLVLNYADAQLNAMPDAKTIKATLFSDAATGLKPGFKHTEQYFFDFGGQRLLPQRYSQLGPPLASGDVNGDGLTDFFVGGAAMQSGKIYMQNSDGSFSSKDMISGPKYSEDISAVFFDADGDKDLDLLVASGSLEFAGSKTYNQLRLYLNDGHGNFSPDKTAIPEDLNIICTSLAIADIDGDGQPDVFAGGRMLTNMYPQSPKSYILKNNHGKFTDVTKDICPSLSTAGMITGAVWTDLNNDQRPDLIICGEWMPVRFFKNVNGKLEETTEATGLKNMNGWWRSIHAADIDHDGDMDLIVGNMGLNNKYHVSPERPAMLYAKDFDANGSIDLIPAYYMKTDKGDYELCPALDRTQFAEELPAIKKLYLLNKDFASVTIEQLLSNLDKKDMIEMKCETNTSMWLENLGDGRFKAHPLPVQAQFAPVNAILADDFNKDGNVDLILAGNEYQTDILTGRYDASYGLLLNGNGHGHFTASTAVESGFIIQGDVKSMLEIENKNHDRFVMAALNNDSLRCFKINNLNTK